MNKQYEKKNEQEETLIKQQETRININNTWEIIWQHEANKNITIRQQEETRITHEDTRRT